MSKSDKNEHNSLQVKNKKAYFDYELIEKVEAGIMLQGTEVKALRSHHGSLDGSYARIHNNEVLLIGAKISPYENAGYTSHDPDRDRKLLLHKSQILKLRQRLEQKGFTLVPLRLYFNDRGYAKIELAVARGKKKYDKRDKITARQMNKETKQY